MISFVQNCLLELCVESIVPAECGGVHFNPSTQETESSGSLDSSVGRATQKNPVAILKRRRRRGGGKEEETENMVSYILRKCTGLRWGWSWSPCLV